MTGALTIARYEVTRRWPLWVVGFGLGVLPLMFSPSAFRTSHPTALSEALLVLGVVMSWVIAFAAGMTLVGRPLHDGRLSFYFTRPISASSVATGKILGGAAAIAGMQVMVALPLISMPDVLWEHQSFYLIGGLAFAGIAFLAAGLVVGILARSRSRWFVVDAIGGTITATVSVFMFAAMSARKDHAARTLDGYQALDVIERVDTLLRVLMVTAAIVLLGAVVTAIARGRTDRERVHRALSFTLWPALTAVALFGLAFAHWGI